MKNGFLKNLIDYQNPNSFASKLRAKRAKHIIELIVTIYKSRGECNILDVGGTANYWNIFSEEFLRAHKVRITLINFHTASIPPEKLDMFDSVVGDACAMPQYKDKSFDLVHSNSVIEHVGLWQDMKSMADEIQRIGIAYYCQTPNFWFPIEPHYLFPMLHWMPFPLRVSLAMRTSLGNWPKASNLSEAVRAQQAALLLDASMIRALFPDSTLLRERFFGLTKSLIVLRSN